MRFWRVLCCVAALSSAPVGAQQQPANSSPIDGPPYKVLHNHIAFEVNADGAFVETFDREFLLRTQEGVQAFSQFSLSFSESMQSGQMVEAYTLKPDGRRIVVPPDQIFTRASPMAAGAPMFNDFKVLVAVLANAEIGDRIGFKAVIRQIKPLIANQFSHVQFFPLSELDDDMSLELSAPAEGFPLQIEAVGIDNPPPVAQDGRLHWKWNFHSDALEPADDGASLDWMARGPRVIISSAADFAAVAKQYEQEAAPKSKPTQAITDLAEQLTKGIDDRREQARVLYEWVANNIRYVAINIGTGAIVPHKADEILSNRYGDCKDHVALLQALLTAKAIPSSGALISTGQHYDLSHVAALQFDHIITYIPEFDVFADSTARHTPFGVLPLADVSKPVLLTATGEVRRSTRLTASGNGSWVTTHVKVREDGTADVDAEVMLKGVNSVNRRAQIANMTRPDQEAAFLRQHFGNNAEGTFDRGDWQNLADHYSFRGHYSLSNYLSVPGPGALGMGMLTTGDSVGAVVQPGLPSRHYDYVCGTGTFSEETVVDLPKSLKILAIPRNAHFRIEGMSFDLTYQQIGPRTVKSTRIVILDRPGRTCTAEFYNTILRPEVLKMRGSLRAMVLYR